jgi:hypothetical protein
MLLQTNSYIVPKDRRSEHARLVRKFRQTLGRLGCDQFEVYEQVGANWASGEMTGRFVQIMRFRDRAHQQQVQAQEKQDPAAQQLIQEFCALINFPYQQQQGLFAVGFYMSALPVAPVRSAPRLSAAVQSQPAVAAPEKREEQADATQPEEHGASLLNFAALAPAASDTDAPLQSDISPAHNAETPLENSANGEHIESFPDTPDRDALFDEFTGDDTRKSKAEEG